MMNVTICGGGIIGASIAYHLAVKGIRSTIIERCSLACGASGKAGGFLARDWCDDCDVGPMARKSFDMHMAFAEDKHFQDCDYRKMDTLGISIQDGSDRKQTNLPDWLNGSIGKSSTMGDTNTTAQVHPYKLTHTFFKLAQDLVGSERFEGIVEGVQFDAAKVVGVQTDSVFIPSDVVIIAMGPWSGDAMKWFHLPPITGERAHSIVVKPTMPISAHACFMEYTTRTGRLDSPEAYPRPDGTVYICGMGDREKLPNDPKDVQYNPDSCKELKHMANSISSAFRDAEIVTEQACYLPTSPDGIPLIGPIPHTNGVFIATGHTCWGILNSPATGEAIAQLVVDGKCSIIDLSPFDPARFLK
jgi:glycine/D-amino acid oxidase-like deaminating enzyme